MQYIITSTIYTNVIHTTQYWGSQSKCGRKKTKVPLFPGARRNIVISSEYKPSKNKMKKTFI